MAVNDTFVESDSGIADGGSLIVDGSTSGTGEVEITELGGTGDAEVYKEVDPDGDGTYEVSVLVADPNDPDVPTSGVWHSQDNNLTVSSADNYRLVITNISGAEASYYAGGFEVGNN